MKLLPLTLLALGPLMLTAQNPDIPEGVNDLNNGTVKKEVIATVESNGSEKIYTMGMVEQKPQFPDGEEAMYRWIGEHINYPAQAAEEGVQGRVIVQFNIMADGSIKNAKVVRSRHPALDEEALRLVNAMPLWIPGRNKGKAVIVSYTLPITFRL